MQKRFWGLLLGVLVTLSMNLSVVQASEMNNMTVEKTAMADMGAYGHADCDHCLGDHGGMRGIICASICSAPTFAILPTFISSTIDVAASTIPSARPHVFLNRTFPPDLPPPRFGDHG